MLGLTASGAAGPQLVLVAAARLAAYVPRLPQRPCPAFLKRIIREIISYASHMIQRKTARCAAAHSGSQRRHVTRVAEERWLRATVRARVCVQPPAYGLTTAASRAIQVELVAWDAFAKLQAGPPADASFGPEMLEWVGLRRAHAFIDAEALAPDHVVQAAQAAGRDPATVHLLHSLWPGRSAE